MLKQISSTVLFTLATVTAVQGQVFFQESFEDAPGSGYTLTTAFDDSFDYFGRYAAPDNSNAVRDGFQNGWDGSFGIQGQDFDGPVGPSATVSITIGGIDISGRSNLEAVFGLGADSSASFDNYDAIDGDGIVLLAAIDGAAAVEIGRFAPPVLGLAGNANQGNLQLDTNGDGIGDGSILTVDLADYAFPIVGTGTSLDLTIQLTSTDSFEPLAFDNARVIQATAVPEPGSIALGVAMLAGLFCRRRR